MKNYFLSFGNPTNILEKMNYSFIKSFDKPFENNNTNDYSNSKIILSIQLDAQGICIPLFEWFSKFDLINFKNSSAVIIVHSCSELFSKTIIQKCIFMLNQKGCKFMGRPMVEATKSLNNFKTLQKVYNDTLENVCLKACENLAKRFNNYTTTTLLNPNLLVLHASNYETSNTLALWHMVQKNLCNVNINTIHIENGTVRDCKGCPYKTCSHYGKQNQCFYGGIMVEEIYPAVLDADAIMFICPNYNDGISANLCAVINRLTALFRQTKFYDKNILGIIVSGSSGGDAIAKQLISALNCNKTFQLPPNAFLFATANDYGDIYKDKINEINALRFADTINNNLSKIIKK